MRFKRMQTLSKVFRYSYRPVKLPYNETMSETQAT